MFESYLNGEHFSNDPLVYLDYIKTCSTFADLQPIEIYDHNTNFLWTGYEIKWYYPDSCNDVLLSNQPDIMP